MSRRAALIAVVAALAACGAPPAPPRAPGVDEQVLAAAAAALECVSDRGAECLQRSPAATGWFAQGNLELLATAPAPVVAQRLLRAHDRMRTGNEAGRRLAELAGNAQAVAEDLSCQPTETAPVGRELRKRRGELIHIAENLGLASTPIATAISELDAAAAALDDAVLVTSACRHGEVYVLLTAWRPRRASVLDDELATPAATTRWRAVAIAATRRALARGAPPGPAAPAPPIDDAPAPHGVDPWIPVGEVEL